MLRKSFLLGVCLLLVVGAVDYELKYKEAKKEIAALKKELEEAQASIHFDKVATKWAKVTIEKASLLGSTLQDSTKHIASKVRPVIDAVQKAAATHGANAVETCKAKLSEAREYSSKIDTADFKKAMLSQIRSVQETAAPMVKEFYKTGKAFVGDELAPQAQKLYKQLEQFMQAQRSTLHGLAQEHLKPLLRENNIELNAVLLVDVICASIIVLVLLSMKQLIFSLLIMLVWSVLLLPIRIAFYLLKTILYYSFCCCCCAKTKGQKKKAEKQAKENQKPPKQVYLQYGNSKTPIAIRPRTTLQDIKDKLKCKGNVKIIHGRNLIQFNDIPGGGKRVGGKNYANISDTKKTIWVVQKV